MLPAFTHTASTICRALGVERIDTIVARKRDLPARQRAVSRVA
jgi:hypothetical protein